MNSVSIANRKQATIFDTNVPTTNGVPLTDGRSISNACRQPTPTNPPTNTTTYISPSASGLNRACIRFIGARGIVGGFMVLAAGAVAPACVTSTVSIACVMGCESSPAVTTSPGDCSCDSIAPPLYWPSADSVVPPIGRATTSWAAVAAFLTHMSLHGAPTYAPWMSDSADSDIQSPAEFSQAQSSRASHSRRIAGRTSRSSSPLNSTTR